jgi:hypothetical protein
MGFQNGWRGPDIVSDGLVLYLDAGSPNSYRTDFGTTWKDMSGFNNSGSLTNGPSFDSASGGSIVFDGTNDYILLPNIAVSTLPSFSICFWANTVSGGTNTTVYSEGTPSSWPDNLFIIYYGDTAFGGQTAGGVRVWFGNSSRLLGTTDLRNTGWNFISYVQDSTSSRQIYVNNTVQSTNTTLITSTATHASIGANNNNGTYVQFFNGNLSALSTYNRALSSQEILQNYNSQKSRFGL